MGGSIEEGVVELVRKWSEALPARRAYTLFEEFRNFAFKGNVIDLAIGVIIGAAFGKLVDSLVKNLIMPAISLVLPAQQTYAAWKVAVNGKEIPYGLFLGDALNFLLVALAVWLFLVKFLRWVIRERKAEEAAPPAPTKEQELLTEIRDLLRDRGSKTAVPES